MFCLWHLFPHDGMAVNVSVITYSCAFLPHWYKTEYLCSLASVPHVTLRNVWNLIQSTIITVKHSVLRDGFCFVEHFPILLLHELIVLLLLSVYVPLFSLLISQVSLILQLKNHIRVVQAGKKKVRNSSGTLILKYSSSGSQKLVTLVLFL